MGHGRSYSMDECRVMASGGELADDHHPNAGAIVVPPKANEPAPER
jgi:hypothetical protein